MKRWMGFVALLVAVAIPAMTYAQAGQAKSTAPSSTAKTQTAMGTVSAVAPDSLTVKGKTAEWTFVIDNKTSVTAKGATHKTLALKAEGKKPILTDFVKNGDSVTVSYRDEGATKHAASIRVNAPAK